MPRAPEDEPGKEAGKENAPLGESVFTPEQRHALEHKGYVIYRLTGQSIASLRDAGYPFESQWHEGRSIEKITSLCAEVAINPTMLFLPDDDDNDDESQMAEFGKKIGGEVPGTTAILGSVADYAEVTFAHLAKTGQRLFGKDFEHGSTYTTSVTGSGSTTAIVGNFGDGDGLDIGEGIMHSYDVNEGWSLAPLVVPSTIGRR